MALTIIIGCIFTVVGICLASFANVLIYRLPRQESLVKPGSHCPKCNHGLAWYENIPLFSYIFLRGRCKECHELISPRYLIVELCGGILSLLAFLKLGLSVDGVITALALIILLTIAFIDLENMVIPLSLNISLGVLAVVKLVLNIILDHSYPWYHYLIGFGGLAIIFVAVYFFSILVLKKEGIGLGDVILLSIAGLFLGWAGGFLVVLFSSLVCSIVMILLICLKKLDRDKPMPFGPYIAGAMMVLSFWASDITNYIMSMF